MITREPFRIIAADGYSLAGTVFRSSKAEPLRRAVLICSAMGVRQAYYRDFADFAAEQGCGVITFDYRGVADSAPKRLRGFRGRLQDWGRLDISAMIAHTRETFPALPMSAVVHSVGGQVLGLAPNVDQLESVLALGAQSGYWRHWDGLDRWRVWLLWHLLIPVLAPLMGFFPSRWFGLGRSIPRDVARQWAHWGRHPRYVVGRSSDEQRAGYKRWAGRMRLVAASDDWIAPERAARGLLELYSGADRQFRLASPDKLDLKAIGHFGYFRKNLCGTLWPAQVNWLLKGSSPES
jgi:predicted alpha/beta hydrolase